MDHLKVYNAIITKSRSENRIKLKRNREGYIYYENHHILPKCLNGGNEEENLVLLTAREHFICHKLLTYIYKGNRKITCAFHRMAFRKKYGKITSSRDYSYARELFTNIPISEETREKIIKGVNKAIKEGKLHPDHKGEKNPMFGKGYLLQGEKNGRFGKPVSLKQIEACKRTWSEESKEKNRQSHLGIASGNKNPMFNTCAYNMWLEKFGKEEADKRQTIKCEKISKSAKGKPKSEKAKQNMRIPHKKIKCEHCNKWFDGGDLKQHQNRLLKENILNLTICI